MKDKIIQAIREVSIVDKTYEEYDHRDHTRENRTVNESFYIHYSAPSSVLGLL